MAFVNSVQVLFTVCYGKNKYVPADCFQLKKIKQNIELEDLFKVFLEFQILF